MSESTHPDEPSAEPEPAPAAAPEKKRDFLSSKAFQLAAIGVAGLAIGGFIGLGTGFAVGIFAGGGHHNHHGKNERFDDRQRQPQRLPAKPLPPRVPGMPAPSGQPSK